MLLLGNILYILFSGWIALGGYRYLLMLPGGFVMNLGIGLILIIGLYITAWVMVGRIQRKKQLFTMRKVCIAMIPNLLVTVLLYVNSYYAHLGFISLHIANLVLVSIFVIPIMVKIIGEPLDDGKSSALG